MMQQHNKSNNDETFQIISSMPIYVTTQCVGFARNWLEIHLGLSFKQVKVAADIWLSVSHFTKLSDTKSVAISNRKNGSRFSPRAGDLIIYHRRLYGTGHVAVVTAINNTLRVIEVTEQHYQNHFQAYNHRRQIPFIKKDEQYWLQDFLIIGWKQAGIGTTEQFKP